MRTNVFALVAATLAFATAGAAGASASTLFSHVARAHQADGTTVGHDGKAANAAVQAARYQVEVGRQSIHLTH